MSYWPDRRPDGELADGQVITAGGIDLRVLQTPGHSPGSSCLYSAELGTVFSGDTLFQGGPGATGRSYSSFDTIIDSIRTTLLTLPGATTVRTGHGDATSIGDEAPHLEEWIAKGNGKSPKTNEPFAGVGETALDSLDRDADERARGVVRHGRGGGVQEEDEDELRP